MRVLLICSTFLFVLFNIVSSGVDPSKFPEYFNTGLWKNKANKYIPSISSPCAQDFTQESNILKTTDNHCALSGTARNLALWYCMKKCGMKNCKYEKIDCQIYHDYEVHREFLRMYCECTQSIGNTCESKGLTLNWEDAEDDFQSECWNGQTVLPPGITASTLGPDTGSVWNQAYFKNNEQTSGVQFGGPYCADSDQEYSVIPRLFCAVFCRVSCSGVSRINCEAPSIPTDTNDPEQIVVKCSCEKDVWPYQCTTRHFAWKLMEGLFLDLCTKMSPQKCTEPMDGIWHKSGSCFVAHPRTLNFDHAKQACEWPYVAGINNLDSLLRSLGINPQLFGPLGQLAFVQKEELVFDKFRWSNKIELNQHYWVGLKNMENSPQTEPKWRWVNPKGEYYEKGNCESIFWGSADSTSACGVPQDSSILNACGYYTKEGVPRISYKTCTEEKKFICEYRAESKVQIALYSDAVDSFNKYKLGDDPGIDLDTCKENCKEEHLCLTIKFTSGHCTYYDRHGKHVVDPSKPLDVDIYDKITTFTED